MYIDDEQSTRFPVIKSFILSLMLVIIFLMLLMWLLPFPRSCEGEECEKRTDTLENRIFNSNLQEMKNSAVFYFTKDRLPKNEGESVTLTLQEIYDAKLMLPFTDSKGRPCNTKDSYVNLTKKQDYYVMKTNLKCDDHENYIMTDLGCYSYCAADICEKKDDGVSPDRPSTQDYENGNGTNMDKTNPACSLYVVEGEKGNDDWYRSNVVVKFKTRRAVTNGATISMYGLGLDSNANYNGIDSIEVSDEGITTIYGYVKDTNGKTAFCSITVKKDTTKPTCSLIVLSGTKSENGSYSSDVIVGFDSKVDATSGVKSYGLSNSIVPVYNNVLKYTISKDGANKVFGFVKDSAGNVGECNMIINSDNPDGTTLSKPSCKLKITSGGIMGLSGWYTNNVTVGFDSKTSTNGATITAFGIGSVETYQGNDSYQVSNDGTTPVYGYVKDSNGYTATCSLSIKKDSVKPTCSLKVTSGTYNSNGYYTSDVVVGFANKTDITSGISAYGIGTSLEFNGKQSYTISRDGKVTVYGYVKDGAGNIGECSITIEKGTTLEYEYQKSIPNQYSDWSNWTVSTYNPGNPPKFVDSDILELRDLGKIRVVDYYKESVGDAFYKYKQVKIGTVKQPYCSGYNYYRDVNTNVTYAVRRDAEWNYVGMITTSNAPTDTLAVKYEFVGFDWKCSGCESVPKEVWNKYTRVVSIANSSDSITTGGSTETCTNVETQSVDIYDTIKTFVDYKIIKTPIYKDVYRFKRRNRVLIKKAYIDYKWSVYDDSNLLNKGYKYTGNTRTIA